MDSPFFDLDHLLTRSGPFANAGFEACVELREFVHSSVRVLVIGAGGLGCELLHSLAKSGFGELEVIDMDTIDVSNLNRQFLFRAADVGKYKADVAAAFVEARCPGVSDDAFYRSFNLIIAGLDSIKARSWISAKLVSLAATDASGAVDMSTVIPLIDGGTEAFKGQARVMLPRISACFQCSISAFPPQRAFQLCTIANTPRKPEHCIAYAMNVLWEAEFGSDRVLDKDSVEDVTWVMTAAAARGAEYGITGITYQLTQGVMKNIIPAIASTNALIAGACVLEAIKIATNCASYLDNWFMYIGDSGINTRTFAWERDESCSVCGLCRITKVVSGRFMTLGELRSSLVDDAALQLVSPSLRGGGKTLYMETGPLKKLTQANLDKTLSEVVSSGTEISVTDANGAVVLVTVVFEEEEGDAGDGAAV
ncbi:NEDD8-activating enzyme E1 catalytic subunit [Thecamonas trahens ATCC 50062]|uniref:NEDD8-activating enzyme E1 catalytic subunit n=1 Tax=Thecamonas trahens ATCC 50062 TaxID=461836 RepID=A0A0L0DSI7_THETB|nr:NEDD8-activating enzyme E1 catalytic subunit [Thecamonas trahens ATCC 50062]KNC55172.1 NEDD8-activating enzyme E1 catalytic subunit [Thecamonas trahens ATCC 50062]|eukprot:XP_013753225.1 NEDD8-activating enzyme E1 catalytic subunit [Thecamonas trahens ATCC 50062]